MLCAGGFSLLKCCVLVGLAYLNVSACGFSLLKYCVLVGLAYLNVVC